VENEENNPFKMEEFPERPNTVDPYRSSRSLQALENLRESQDRR
jgi:hypothetical protein